MKKLFLSAFLMFLYHASFAQPAVTIALDSSVKYQVMTGWEACKYITVECDPAGQALNNLIIPKVVNDIGITRLRVEVKSGSENSTDYYANWIAKNCPASPDTNYTIWRYNRYANVNDNYDTSTINWSGFHFTELDWNMNNIVMPFKQQVEANGEKFHLNLCYVAFTGQIQGGVYIQDTIAEYAEFVLATYQHMQNTFGVIPDTWEFLLEPDLSGNTQWKNTNGTHMGKAIVAVANKLISNGFPAPRFVVPSTTRTDNAWKFFDNINAIPGALQYIEEISYHRYQNATTANVQQIANRGIQYNKNTSMLEWWSSGYQYPVVHEDLEVGRNSSLQQSCMADFFSINKTNPLNPTATITDITQYNRLYYKYVRPGAQRIDALSSDTTKHDALSWINTNGMYTVVVKADTTGRYKITGLPPGLYGTKYTTSTKKFYTPRADTLLTVSGDTFYTEIPAKGVLAIHGISPIVTASHTPVPVTETALVFPNPSKGSVRISFNNTAQKKYSLALFNVQGEIVRTITGITGRQLTIEREDLSPGLYLFRMAADDGSKYVSGKIMME